MTFKSTSKNLSHLERVASASTRPKANGRIDLIPSDAREPEEYYNTIRDQYLSMNARLRGYQVRLAELKLEMRETLPFSRFSELKKERDLLAEQYTALQKEIAGLRSSVRESGKDAWAVTFYGVARRILDRDTFMKVENEVRNLLGRPIVEISAGEAEYGEKKQESRRKSGNRNQARRQFRAKMAKREALQKRDGGQE